MKRRRSMLQRISIALSAFTLVALPLVIAAGRPVMAGMLYLADALELGPRGGGVAALPPVWFERTAVAVAAIVSLLPALWVAIATYHRMTFNPVLLDGRTRCGQCGAVMNGLTEPRCPSCGKAI